jgi:hypothetical protein
MTPGEKKKTILAVAVMILIIAGTAVHYAIYRHNAARREAAGESTQPKSNNVIDLLTGKQAIDAGRSAEQSIQQATDAHRQAVNEQINATEATTQPSSPPEDSAP